jgi:diguanylate cyclase
MTRLVEEHMARLIDCPSEIGAMRVDMSCLCADGDRAHGDTEPARLAVGSVPGSSSNVGIGDWEVLLGAVKTRLMLAVDERAARSPEHQGSDTSAWVRSTVLECVGALDQLHTTLAHELERRQRLEMEVLDAQTTLAQTRAELLGTQAGERKARHLALHDGLTSLPNGRFFRERLDGLLSAPGPRRGALAVLYLDLDGFKTINDVHGHEAGDALLKIVAARLSRAVRAEDMVSRLGGDEFACLLEGRPSRMQLDRLAKKLFLAVSSPLQIDKLRLSVRPSIGIATCPSDGDTAEALLKHADAAMYRAKRRRSGHAFFDQDANW